LWMGVPVISLTGSTHASRVGCSLLTALGFPGWVARTPAEYMSLALKLCSEREQLSGLRSTLRDRMLASSIMDAKAFVHGLEGAYREAWRRWCAGREQGKG